MLIVAAGEQDVLPAWGLLQALDGVIVINEQVPHDHCLIPSQDNPLHKLRPQVLFHPSVLYRKNKTKLELNRL